MAVNDRCFICGIRFEEGEKAILVADVSLTYTNYGTPDSYTRKIVEKGECRVRFSGSKKTKRVCHDTCFKSYREFPRKPRPLAARMNWKNKFKIT